MAKRVAFTAQAKADLRAVDQQTALQILKTLSRFAHSEEGNVKRLQGADPPLYAARPTAEPRRDNHRTITGQTPNLSTDDRL